MDRPLVYPGQVPADTDFLTMAKAAMLGFNGVLGAAFGSGTLYQGLAVSAGSGLEVAVGPGSLIAAATTDATAYGSLGADSTSIVKQGIITSSTTLGPFTAPATSGQSVNILIQAAFSETDTNSALLLYYNASNPGTPYGGSNNSGVSQPTLRKQSVALSYVAGTAATTGTQTTPSASAGCIPLSVVTIAAGQTSISTISQVTTYEILSNLGNVLQSGGSTSDSSSALATSGWVQAVLALYPPRSAFTASLATSGYRIDPCSSSSSGKIITQWGVNSVGAPSQVTFPTTFPNAALGLVVCEAAAATTTWGAAKPTVHGYANLSQTGYQAWAEAWTGSIWQGGSITQAFIAVGY